MMAMFRICIAWKYTSTGEPQTSSGVNPLACGTGLRQSSDVHLYPGRRCPMHQQHDPDLVQYPHGRGYGHDYMRGGEVLGGYGYSMRGEYEAPRGEVGAGANTESGGESDAPPGTGRTQASARTAGPPPGPAP